jgi:hypothetical protein
MNIAFQIRPPTRSIAVRLLLTATIIGSATIPAAADAQKDKPVVMDKLVVAETKTHTLFMGADIAVNLGKDLYPVRGVVRSSWIIDVNGEEKVVSARQAPLNLKVTPSLKLTDVFATIVNYKKERAYSFKNDPSVRLSRGLTEAASMNADLMAVASNAQHIADTINNKALGGVGQFATADDSSGLSSLTAHRAAEGNAALEGTTVSQLNANAYSGQVGNAYELGGRTEETGLDAMDVEFEISSARPLQKPYAVTMTRFHPKGTKPGTVQNLVYARELEPIGAHPTDVHFVESGFPYDFELVDFQLHVYNNGEEVATTVSSRRVELTRDEAFEYVKIEYIGAHKRDTLPPSPAMGVLPADLPRRLAEGDFKEKIFVRVSKDGLADEPFVDATCSTRIEDPYLQKVVRSLRFKPALAQGNPVDGITSLDLRQLKI